ncbi:hypothetical protein HYPSUDRAFT_92750 [Hypholoma sublateritium FD-334 SS-4]|uniref:Uncharacterized protein n=1 Tax=Hypholoma sublateritium (strain FD-334 SS-4) TaxID=945553 RepID=A0A0D2N9W3_HYPSF|nr:hypothetical protein HYPSUDRAFT_92750 [Hypholoma sublateritium FD-334 SS-4]
MLSWDSVDRITPLITGGADLIFKGQPRLKRIEFRIMWTGYVDPKEDEKYYIAVDEATTRAKLGHIVAILVFKFMKEHGIGVALALASLNNVYDSSWQATLHIL